MELLEDSIVPEHARDVKAEAREFARESSSFIVRRKCVRQLVTFTVNTMYVTSAANVTYA